MEISNGHNQEMALIHPISASNFPHNPQQEKNPKYPQNYQAPNSCPRCDSTNTKFCYYNNYSLSQPRYFCKACRRYWTKGGILRNVPVGGGCRKNKRSSSSTSPNSSSNSAFAKKSLSHDLLVKNITKPPSESMAAAAIPDFPMSSTNDLTLAFNPFFLDQNPNPNPNPNPSFLDILRGGGVVEPTQEISHGGFQQSLCYGFGGGGNDQQRGMLNPFHVGAGGGRTPPLMAAAAPGMAAVRDDDGVGGNHDGEVGLGLETGSRDNNYWNDSGSVSSSSTWHGLVNSSFL